MAFFPSGFAEAISTNRPLCDGRRVKPPAFAYRSVETVAALLELRRAAGEDAQILAGGQSLMPMINMRIARPAMLIDINPVMALRYVRPDAGFVEIGAMTRWRDLEDSAEIAALAPLVAQALPLIAHPAVRNRGTVGGSLALADPAAELPACVLALGGELLVASADQRRTKGSFGACTTPRSPLTKRCSDCGCSRHARRNILLSTRSRAATATMRWPAPQSRTPQPDTG